MTKPSNLKQATRKPACPGLPPSKAMPRSLKPCSSPSKTPSSSPCSIPCIIGTLRGGGGGVGDYTCLNGPYQVLITDIKAPYPPPTPLRVPMIVVNLAEALKSSRLRRAQLKGAPVSPDFCDLGFRGFWGFRALGVWGLEGLRV